MARNKGAGSPEPGHDFIGDQVKFVFSNQAFQFGKVALRMCDHSGSALNQRLDNEGGIGFAGLLGSIEFLFDFPDAFPFALACIASVFATGLGAIVRAAVAIGCHDAIDCEANLTEGFVEERTVAQAHGADGIAVVAAFEREVSWRDFGSGTARVLVMQFESGFHCRRAVVGKEDLCEFGLWAGFRSLCQPGGLDQFFGQVRGWFVREAEGRGVADLFELILDRSIDLWVVVPVKVRPDRSIGVDV